MAISLDTVRGFTLALVVACTALPVFAQDMTWDRESVRTSDFSPCRPVFGARMPVPEYVCNECKQFLETSFTGVDLDNLLGEIRETAGCENIEAAFDEKDESGFSFYLDQDFLVPFGEEADRDYTMGVGFLFSGENYSEGLFADARKSVDDVFSIYASDNTLEEVHSFEFGLLAFTPDDFESEDPIEEDRPFASLLYVSNSKLVAYNSDYAIKTRLVLGILGLEIAEEIQKTAHNDWGFSDRDPGGWENQISDGGELTALYSYEKLTRWKFEDNPEKTNWDLTISRGLNLGYYTNLHLGLDYRVGKISSPYYSHSSNPSSTINHGLCDACNVSDDNYFFAGYKIRLVGYNVMLQGQGKSNPVEFESDEIERVLHELGVGWTINVTKRDQLTYAMNYRSEEFEGSESRSSYFGGIYWSRNFDRGSK